MKLKLSLPTIPYGLAQPFGVNGEYYRLNGINIAGHNGLDLRAFHGQPIYASHDGHAIYQDAGTGGQGVVVITDQRYEYKDSETYFKTIFWHMCDHVAEPKYASPIYLKQQEIGTNKTVPVKAGDLIGYADNTGLSTGDHLHFGLKPIKSGKSPYSGDAPDVMIGPWENVEPNNGYGGAIDPMPYLDLPQSKYMFNRDLSYGSFGNDVIKLQERLSVSPTWPVFGPKTKAAVIAFQKAHGIDPVGVCGPITRAYLNTH